MRSILFVATLFNQDFNLSNLHNQALVDYTETGWSAMIYVELYRQTERGEITFIEVQNVKILLYVVLMRWR